MAGADISSLTIKELAGAKRRITLRGPSLPFRPTQFAASNRVVTTWYPGNSFEATQHVLGPTELPSTWDGVWRTTQMFRTPAFFAQDGGSDVDVVRAFELRELLEDMFRSGSRLRAEWRNQIRVRNPDGSESIGDPVERRVVREGRAVDWAWDYDRADDIGWTITFDWSSRGAQQQKAVASRRDSITSTLNSLVALANELAVVSAQLQGIKSKTLDANIQDRFTLGELENFVGGVTDSIDSFTRAVTNISSNLQKIGDLVQQVRSLPSSVANSALDAANSLVSVTNQFLDDLSRRPPEANLVAIKASQLSRASEATAELAGAAGTIRDAALEARRRLQESSKAQNTVLAVHIARGTSTFPVPLDPNDPSSLTEFVSGEALADISKLFFKTVDHAASIAQANNLPLNQTFALRGTILVIPTLSAIKGFNPVAG